MRSKESVRLGHIRNVTFTNVSCRAENGILLYGSTQSALESTTLNNPRLEFVGSSLNDVAGGKGDLLGALEAKTDLFAHNIPTFLTEHVDGLTINDFKLGWHRPHAIFLTHDIKAGHFQHLCVACFTGTGNPNNATVRLVVLRNSTAAVDRFRAGVRRTRVQKR